MTFLFAVSFFWVRLRRRISVKVMYRIFCSTCFLVDFIFIYVASFIVVHDISPDGFLMTHILCFMFLVLCVVSHFLVVYMTSVPPKTYKTMSLVPQMIYFVPHVWQVHFPIFFVPHFYTCMLTFQVTSGVFQR